MGKQPVHPITGPIHGAPSCGRISSAASGTSRLSTSCSSSSNASRWDASYRKDKLFSKVNQAAFKVFLEGSRQSPLTQRDEGSTTWTFDEHGGSNLARCPPIAGNLLHGCTALAAVHQQPGGARRMPRRYS